MKLFPEDVDRMFEVRPLTLEQKYAKEQIFGKARDLAQTIRHLAPEGETQEVAIRKVREAALLATDLGG